MAARGLCEPYNGRGLQAACEKLASSCFAVLLPSVGTAGPARPPGAPACPASISGISANRYACFLSLGCGSFSLQGLSALLLQPARYYCCLAAPLPPVAENASGQCCWRWSLYPPTKHQLMHARVPRPAGRIAWQHLQRPSNAVTRGTLGWAAFWGGTCCGCPEPAERGHAPRAACLALLGGPELSRWGVSTVSTASPACHLACVARPPYAPGAGQHSGFSFCCHVG